MPPTPSDLRRSAVCRALLAAANLAHLWEGRSLKRGTRALLDDLARHNPRDAAFLWVAITLAEDDFEGPTLRRLLDLDQADTVTLLTAPLAVDSARQCQVWLALMESRYGLVLGSAETRGV